MTTPFLSRLHELHKKRHFGAVWLLFVSRLSMAVGCYLMLKPKAASFKITLSAPNSFQQTPYVTLTNKAELEIEEMCSALLRVATKTSVTCGSLIDSVSLLLFTAPTPTKKRLSSLSCYSNQAEWLHWGLGVPRETQQRHLQKVSPSQIASLVALRVKVRSFGTRLEWSW